MSFRCCLGLFCLSAMIAVSGCRLSVALYNEPGTDEGCVAELASWFTEKRHRITLLAAEELREDALDSFDLLCFPTGDMPAQARAIGLGGSNTIRDHVRAGGGLILLGESTVLLDEWLGISSMACMQLRSRFACELASGLFEPLAQTTSVEIELYGENHFITEGGPNTMALEYDPMARVRVMEDPAFFSNAALRTASLARFSKTGDVVMMAAEYGRGRVFASSIWAPEILENKLMHRAAAWTTGRSKPISLPRKRRARLQSIRGTVAAWIGLALFAFAAAASLLVRMRLSRPRRPPQTTDKPSSSPAK